MIAKIYPDGHPDVIGLPRPARYFDIRKLTERECLRLMDVPQWAIDLLTDPATNDGIARSNLYKLAGNSIVVSCLYHIFKNIWLTEDDPSEAMDLFAEPTFRMDFPDKIRMITLCSGYDSQALGMARLCSEAIMRGHTNARFDLLNWAEFDPESRRPLQDQPAVRAHNVLFPQWADRNLGDMTKIDWQAQMERYRANGDDDVDVLFYSTPCQSISQSGKREGMKKDSGTRSAVLWYTENAIAETRPKILIQENVAAMANAVNMPDFKEWQDVCKKHGYNNYWKILNAKDYGVPQNRERVFMVSVRQDLNMPRYRFPKPFKLEVEVKDILEETDDPKYFLDAESVTRFLRVNDPNPEIIYKETDHFLSEGEIEAEREKASRRQYGNEADDDAP